MTSNPFVDAIDADLNANAVAPEGYEYVTPREVGIHYKPEDDFMNHRKIALKPTRDEAGMRAWEARTQANQAAVDSEKNAIMYVCGQGLSPWSDAGRAMMADIKSGKINIAGDTNSILMAMPDRARSESAAETTARLKRMREEARSGVRLEKPPAVIRLGR